ncbi:MAG: hypothetical protein A2992_08395 [Elusimicrobia bacterium RIFCSPLOWO2_01_FULL_59_12]|nr:MAG: hypothetical protein A2992_08395 [Elusimicrobia bacterium RIFCSPLOWO2_01_FULL_59_12]
MRSKGGNDGKGEVMKNKKVVDDKDLTGLTPKQIEKRKRLIAYYEKHGSPEVGIFKTVPKNGQSGEKE